MRKLITILTVLTILSTSVFAFPKFTMLNTGSGNTKEYTAQFVELDKTKKIEKEQAQYISFLKYGTWIIEFDDGQKVYVSIYKDKPIAGGIVKELK